MFKYYPPASSVYHKVELEDVSDECSDDTKLCAKKITINEKLSIEKLVSLQIDYIKDHCTNEHNAGQEESATVGDGGAATAGDYGDATAGCCGVAMVGHCGSSTTGAHGVAIAGDNGVSKAGDVGLATAGYCGIAMTENDGVAKAGKLGVATSRGHSSVGENGVAFARGNDVMVKGELGAIIFIVEEQDLTYDIREWKAGVIDGKTLKPNTWYKLENGEFVECE